LEARERVREIGLSGNHSAVSATRLHALPLLLIGTRRERGGLCCLNKRQSHGFDDLSICVASER
jgi:hypothetical protein